MKQLFKEIYAQLTNPKDPLGNPVLDGNGNSIAVKDNNGAPAYIRMWNNQIKLLMEGNMEMFQTPAYFIEFETANTNELVGGEGVQLYDPLFINIHIAHWQLNATGTEITGDGTFEQNLDVFDCKQTIYKILQKFKASKSSPFVRVSERQDYEHEGVYHFVQRYCTTWVDGDMQEPVGGSETNLPLTLEIDLFKRDAGKSYDDSFDDSFDDLHPHVYIYSIAKFKFSNLTNGTPAAGILQFNKAIPSQVTMIYVNSLDIDNIPIGDVLSMAKVNDVIKIVKDDTNFVLFKITSIAQNIGQADFGVSFISVTGTVSNNDKILFIII